MHRGTIHHQPHDVSKLLKQPRAWWQQAFRDENMAAPARLWQGRDALKQSNSECTAWLHQWQAARDVDYIGEVPAENMLRDAARFEHLRPSALPPLESVLRGYPGEEPWHYIHLGYPPQRSG